VYLVSRMGKVEFHVEIHRQPAQAGSSVTGAVYLSNEKEIASSDLVLQLVGAEKTTVHYTRATHHHGSGKNRKSVSKRYTAHGSRNIIEATIPVSAATTGTMIQMGRILPGTYKVPFEVDLPPFLPPTMKETAGKDSCAIKYTIKALLKGSGKRWDYGGAKTVQVTTKPLDTSRPPVPFEGPPCHSPVSFCRCLGRGEITFGCLMKDTKLQAGGPEVTLSMACRNNSASKIDSVQAEVEQVTSWSAQSHKKSWRKNLVVKDFGSWSDLDKVDKNARAAPSGEENEEIWQEMKAGYHSVKIAVPYDALPTYQGRLIQVCHTLILTLTTGCCVTNPTIIIPIQIMARSEGQEPAVATSGDVLPATFTTESLITTDSMHLP
jgi:hypothetical protein